MKKLLALTLSLTTVFLGGCFSDEYQGFFYPNGCLSCESDWIVSEKFEKPEQCIDWAMNLQGRRDNPNDDFECGKNCEFKSEYGMQVCETTFDSL